MTFDLICAPPTPSRNSSARVGVSALSLCRAEALSIASPAVLSEISNAASCLKFASLEENKFGFLRVKLLKQIKKRGNPQSWKNVLDTRNDHN